MDRTAARRATIPYLVTVGCRCCTLANVPRGTEHREGRANKLRRDVDGKRCGQAATRYRAFKQQVPQPGQEQVSHPIAGKPHLRVPVVLCWCSCQGARHHGKHSVSSGARHEGKRGWLLHSQIPMATARGPAAAMRQSRLTSRALMSSNPSASPGTTPWAVVRSSCHSHAHPIDAAVRCDRAYPPLTLDGSPLLEQPVLEVNDQVPVPSTPCHAA